MFLYPEKDKFQVLLIAHHLLADGRSLLSLACEFANSYVNGVVPNFVEESLIQNIYDLPLGTGLSFISKRVVGQANKQWQKESRKVTYDEYMHFANNFAHENPTSHERVFLIEDDTDTIIKLCKDNDISVNDYLLAGLFDVAKPKNIIVAVDIRNKLACYQEGALGNYASALSVFCKEKSDDVFKQAKAIHQQIQLSLNDNKKLMAILACYLSM